MPTTRLLSLRAATSTLAVLAALLPAACGGGGGGGGGAGAAARTDILLRDAPADDLLSFQGTILEVRLDDDLGGSTSNLLSAPVTQEFLGLQSSFAWLSNQALPPGNYTAVRLSFQPGSYSARRNDGTEVAVDSISDELVASFATPLVVTATNYSRVVLDLDLVASLQGSIDTPPLQFDPRGTAVHDSGSSETQIDEIKGVVESVDTGANTFVIDAFVDDDGIVPLGPVAVTVTGATLLLQDDGTTFGSRALFFGSLVPGSTAVEVHGALVNGTVQATRVEIEDNAAGGGNGNLVKIRGRVLDLGPGNELEMSIAEVDDGAAIVAAAFGGTVPATLQVDWDANTVFFLEEHQITTSDSLAVGQEVHVKFAVFDNPPFVASRMEIEDEDVEFEGDVTSVAGLPASFVIHLRADDPAILSGAVASTSTDVVVQIGSSPIFLDVEGDPALAPAAILVGQKVQPEGSLSGPPTSPTIAATEIKVFAGRLDDSTVSAATRASHTFQAVGGEIDDPFGGGVVAGDLEVQISPGAVFEGDAGSEAEFFDLFEGLQAGQTLIVEVRGIGSGTATAILGHEIDARVED